MAVSTKRIITCSMCGLEGEVSIEFKIAERAEKKKKRKPIKEDSVLCDECINFMKDSL